MFMLRKKVPLGGFRGDSILSLFCQWFARTFHLESSGSGKHSQSSELQCHDFKFYKNFFLKIITIYGILFIFLNKIICKARVNH